MLARNLRAMPVRASVRSFGSSSVCSESYTEKQAKLGRPVSPHVTIYKFPITALSSITNRVTGVALSVGESTAGFSYVGTDFTTCDSSFITPCQV
jgi:succinate dehydrogenase (ubiquinone) cytochrome b560 subunit